MEQKSEIDFRRRRSGYVDIGTEDEGGIKQLINVDGKLLTIKERAIYEVNFADDLDPERKNPKLPLNIQKKIIDLGSDSELASRTYLMALNMLKPEYIVTDVDVKRAREITLELLLELHQLDQERDDYLAEEKSQIDEYQDRKIKKLHYKLPAIPDIVTRCKTFFSKEPSCFTNTYGAQFVIHH